jgi:protein KRI1
VEEKYKHDPTLAKDDEDANSDSSSSDETEDEDGFLATEDLDAQISATLNAIKNKDPRVYDKDAVFFKTDDGATAETKQKKEKPVFLKDYHRDKIMRGDTGALYEEGEEPKTYVEEQDALKQAILSEINAAGQSDSDDSDGEAFVKKKTSTTMTTATTNGAHPSRSKAIAVAELDVSMADKNPELYLSNFMSSRAWVPADGSNWKAFESDDEEDDGKADEFEQAYNMRFEDPDKSNEVLRTYARDIAAAKSVRRKELTGRQRQRELEKEKKEAEKQERREERSRLKRLKVDEAEEKLKKIKHAAGKSGKNLKDEEWVKFLEDAWENDAWEEEMKKRFDDEYYAQAEVGSESDQDRDNTEKKNSKKAKKPRWDDDIDIKDIIPDFDEEEENPAITLSDSEVDDTAAPAEDEDDEDEETEHPSKKRKTSKDHKKDRVAAKRAAKQERAKLEALVDVQMELDNPTLLAPSSSKSKSYKKQQGLFRYRETSPNSFGMTPRDILLAPSDTVLNEFAGLKKLATFRDEEKKRKDKKRLGKKARLRQWRRDVFGKEYEQSGPTYGFETLVTEEGEEPGATTTTKTTTTIGDSDQKKRKRKRSKGKSKKDGVEAS